jgi:hypothetical protein
MDNVWVAAISCFLLQKKEKKTERNERKNRKRNERKEKIRSCACSERRMK